MKTGKRILPLTLVLLFLFSLFPFQLSARAAEPEVWDGTIATGFAGGSGTETDPYLIETPAQLAYLAKIVNSGTNSEGTYFQQTQDIVLNAADMFAHDENGEITGVAEGKTPLQWVAIGSHDYGSTRPDASFRGTFDGGDHSITGLFVDTTEMYQGLFGYCIDATLQNIHVKDSYVRGYRDVGGIVGRIANSTVQSCENSSTVIGISNDTVHSAAVGGIVGECFLSNNTVRNCTNSGSIHGGYTVAGIVGYNLFSSTVQDCVNTGTTDGQDDSTGGIVGRNLGTVKDCINRGSSSGQYDVGGITGRNNGIVQNCTNYGRIHDATEKYIGGIAGRNYGTVQNCTNNGSVESTHVVGGIAGFNSGAVNNCTNRASVSGSYNTGGIAGYNVSGTVSLCINSNSVSGNNCTGYIVGQNFANENIATVQNCYYSGLSDLPGATNGGGEGTEIIDTVVALTDVEMRDQSNFVGFDFENTWTMEGDPEYPYPELTGKDALTSSSVVTWSYDSIANHIIVNVSNSGDIASCVCAFYDSNGKLLSVQMRNLKEGNHNYGISFDKDNAKQVKLFVWGENFNPLQPAESIEIS